MASPNMGLIIPDPLVTVGPDWAEDISDSLGTIDEHDHTSGNGVLIPAAALNINANLPFNSFAATELSAIFFEDQIANPTPNGAVYIKNGDFFLKNTAGQVIQLTSGSNINTAAGSISGLVSPASASFSSITNTFSWLYDVNLPARQVMSNISLYEYGNSSANPITIASPAGVTAYTFTLPATVPARGSLLKMSTTGAVSTFSSATPLLIPRMNAGATDLEYSQVQLGSMANNSVDTPQLVDGSVFIQKLYPRAFSGTPAGEGAVLRVDFSTTLSATSSTELVTGNINTRGRPVVIALQAQQGTSASTWGTGAAITDLNLEVRKNGSIIAYYQWFISTADLPNFMHIAVSDVGMNTFSINAYKGSGGQPNVAFNLMSFLVYEL